MDCTRIEYLRAKALALPLSPGVYLMKDVDDKIIYVGKSKALRNRVSSYFVDLGNHTPKTLAMVQKVYDFEVMLTNSEIEALALENRLIKLHTPHYNIKLKDGKNYPYIRLSSEDYPLLSVERKIKKDGAKYFGPYSGTSVAYSILNTVRKSFGIPSCKKKFPRDIPSRPCINSQIGVCCGLCSGKISPAEYKARFPEVSHFLRGNFARVRKSLNEKMEIASENLMFETAAGYRDSIRNLERLWDRQKVVGTPDTEYDVISSFSDDSGTCVGIFYIRDGALIDRQFAVFPADEIFDGEAFQSLLYELYSGREYVPSDILLGEGMPEADDGALTAFLRESAGRAVYLRNPKQGDTLKLCEMVAENCAEELRRRKEQSGRETATLVRLAELLRLEILPERIEAFDISNFGNENITAGKVVLNNGKFEKQSYRTYKIESTDIQDDYMSMREVLSRRLAHTEDLYPDLILLDGGKAHVSVIRQLLRELGTDIPVFGMVKDDFHKTRALTDGEREISIAHEQQIFTFIYRLQEEVHRFTVSRMSQAKRKTVKKSVLENINGIGPAKAAALLHAFGGLGAVKKADPEELLTVRKITAGDAANIIAYFEKEKKL